MKLNIVLISFLFGKCDTQKFRKILVYGQVDIILIYQRAQIKNDDVGLIVALSARRPSLYVRIRF